MRTLLLILLAGCLICAAQSEQPEDRRIVRQKGYHIVSQPARVGETPPDVKQEKSDEDNRRHRNNTDITGETAPTRQPELKPKDVKP